MSLPRFEDELLKRARVSVRPDPARRAAAKHAMMRAAGVGLAAGVATTASAAGATGATGATTTTAATAATGGAAKLLAAAKLVVIGAVALGGAGTAVVVATRSHEPAPVTASASASANASANANAGIAPTAAVPSLSISDLPAVPVAALAVVPAAGPADPLSAEARVLEAARACLRAADTGCARARLRDHAAQFPSGALVEEAEVLAIDVARADGDKNGARALAASFVRRRPASAYAPRARAALRDLSE
ncbi:MAG: hypothetical protein JWO86_727 [Myxococcaceae bacterium]|nr:hypothetical protein [Myxococcaceae bacterium]